MARDTVRADSAFQTATADILPDNNTGDIDAIDVRDLFATLRDRDKKKGTSYSSSASLTVDLSVAATQHVILTQNISSVSFANVPPVNLLWPSEDITHANFTIGASTTVSAVNVLDAFGGSTADRLTMTNGGSTIWTFPFRARLGAVYTFQAYLQDNGAPSLSMDFETTAGSDKVSQNVSATASWGRYSVTWTADATDAFQVSLDNRANTTANDVYVAHVGLYASDLTDYVYTSTGPSGETARIKLILEQDGTGSRTVSWGSRVLWASATPTLSTTASSRDVIELFSWNGGAEWYGSLIGKGFA